jgi:hypothetical protein
MRGTCEPGFLKVPPGWECRPRPGTWDILFILHPTCHFYTHGWIYTIDRYYEILMNLYGTHIYTRIHSRYSLMKLFLIQHWSSSDSRDVPDVGLHNCQIPLIRRARVRWEPPPSQAPVRRPGTEDSPILLRQGPVLRGDTLLRRGPELLGDPGAAGCRPHRWGDKPGSWRRSVSSRYAPG